MWVERSKAAFAFALFVVCGGQVLSNHGLINNAKNKLDAYTLHTLHHLPLLLLASGGSNASIELFTINSFN